MIGQEYNIQLLRTWRINKSIPRFIIIEGDTGSGRLTFAKAIIKQINATGIICGNSINDIREVIHNSYMVTTTTCYIFRDCDDMSIAAKNSILKVVEEPPNNVYFIMTIKSTSNMLNTVISRATCVKMAPYTQEQIKQITNSALILRYATNIGQAKEYDEIKLKEAEQLCDNIYNSLSNTSGLGVLKGCTGLQAKATETDKINCELFLKVFMKNIPISLFSVTVLGYIEKCKQEMKRGTVNQKASIECMLLRMLEEFKNAKVS